jgi:hypothetical protein
MNQPRVDLYGIIHKALRSQLFETGIRVSRTNFADPAERSDTIAAYRRTMAFVNEHGGHEDSYVEPVLRRVSPALADDVSAQHGDIESLAAALDDQVAELEGSAGLEAVAAGARFDRAYCGFLAAYTAHMEVEEGPVNDAMWSAYSDDELVAVRTELQASIPPPRFAEWFAIMTSAMNHQERVGVLSGVKMGAPPDVFAGLSAVTRTSIGDEAWAAVEAQLPA